MVKVQSVGAVVGWIISIVWIVFFVLIITNYANKSAFVRFIHTILLPFDDVNLRVCKYFAIAFCVSNFFASQIWRYGVQYNKKQFTMYAMIWFSLVLGFLLICILCGLIGTDLQKEHPELIVILIVSIVIFGHLYIITYASFRVIKEEVHRTPILERQSDSSYSIPLRSLRESNSMQTTVPSDYGYKSDDGGDADAPMYCIPVTPTAPIDDGFDIGYPIKSVHYEIPNVDHPFNDAQKCYTDDFQKYDPYRRTEHSDYKIPLDEPKDSNLSYQAYSYLHHNRESSYKEPEYNTHTAPESVDRTNDLYSAPSHNDTSQSNHDTNTSIQQDTCTSDNTTDTCAAAADNTDSATCD